MRDSIASIRDGSDASDSPVGEVEAGAGRVTLVTPRRTPPETERVVTAVIDLICAGALDTVFAAGRLVVLVMGARGTVAPLRAGTNAPVLLTDRGAGAVRVAVAVGSRSLLGPAPDTPAVLWRLTDWGIGIPDIAAVVNEMVRMQVLRMGHCFECWTNKDGYDGLTLLQ